MNLNVSEEYINEEASFVFTSMGMGAITFNEFKTWVDIIVSTHDQLPTYFFDFYDAKASWEAERFFREKFNSIPSDGLNDKEAEVLWGIAAKRGLIFDEDCISRKTALKRLEQYPHVVERFKKTFPFIKLDF